MIVNGVGGGNDTDSPVVGTDSSLIKVAVQMVHQVS